MPSDCSVGRNGDESALGRLFRFAYLMLGEPSLAAEVARDAIARAGHEPSKPLPPGDEEALGRLYGAALELCRSRIRRYDPDRIPMTMEEAVVEDPHRPPTTAALQEEHQKLVVAAAGLLPGLREVFILRFVEALPVGAVAQACRITRDAVQTRIDRARALMRTELADFARYLSADVLALLEAEGR